MQKKPALHMVTPNEISAEELAAQINDDPIALAMVNAYRTETQCDEISRAGATFASAVSTMINIDPKEDPESVVSDLRWLGRMIALATEELENTFIYAKS